MTILFINFIDFGGVLVLAVFGLYLPSWPVWSEFVKIIQVDDDWNDVDCVCYISTILLSFNE